MDSPETKRPSFPHILRPLSLSYILLSVLFSLIINNYTNCINESCGECEEWKVPNLFFSSSFSSLLISAYSPRTPHTDATRKTYLGFAAPLPPSVAKNKRTPTRQEQPTSSGNKEVVSVGVQTDSVEKVAPLVSPYHLPFLILAFLTLYLYPPHLYLLFLHLSNACCRTSS